MIPPKFTVSHPITTALTRIERARGFLEAAKLSEDWIRRAGERALILEAHHTTHIEGTRLTLAQAERLWAGEHVPGTNPDDVRELLNYREAFEFNCWLYSVPRYPANGMKLMSFHFSGIYHRL